MMMLRGISRTRLIHSISSPLKLHATSGISRRTENPMAMRAIGTSSSSSNLYRIRIRASADGNPSPGAQFAMLAAVFRRRVLTGLGTASVVAVGANFGGIASSLLSLNPDLARNLRLDLLYPIQGFTRCFDPDNGFEFVYPASWVGDQTLLYRAVGNAESQRSLDPPPLSSSKSKTRSLNEPAVAYGPPGSNGELNVSVIVSQVPRDFLIEAFGGPKEVGEAVLKKIAGSKRGSEITATLVDASLRQDTLTNVNYYKLEFRVESPTFCRHNVAVCAARDGKLYTLNAQAPESAWLKVRDEFCKLADSFNLTEV